MNPTTTGTVLVVDDQERNVQVLGTTLSNAGFQVMAASSGQQALKRVAAHVPDLVLLDILMPGMDGFEVCKRLQSDPETAGLPVIFISAADEGDVIVRALAAGGVDYVTKPFNSDELLARVRTHIELKRSRDVMRNLISQREEFIAMMAHDLKSPLGGAKLSIELLAEMADRIGDKPARLAGTARDGIGRALDLIEGFLGDAESALTDLNIRCARIDLASCVAEAISRHQQAAARKRITIEWERSEVDALVQGDAEAIGRVLDNLLSNAVKFSFPERRVWIKLDAARGKVVVRDEGPGFTAEDRTSLFVNFQRLSAKPTAGEPSTGLGLSSAKRLVEAMRGSLELSEGYSDGAEFVVTLPLPE
ncbi:MAG: two-component system sensor histidine kinase/response regulator [Verrucomicrobiales bacterium]|jgi:two-component system sensor histidine kinase/response regulator